MSERDTIYVDVWFEMRIAIIIERAEVGLGGAERSIFELATAISKRGPEVNILTAKGKIRHTRTKNVHILCRDNPGKRACYSTFAGALKKHKENCELNLSILCFFAADNN